MKKYIITSTLLAISIAYLSCSDPGTTMVHNEYLLELPSVAKAYQLKTNEKEKEISESKDLEKLVELDKELEQLKNEWTQKIEEAKESMELSKALEFEALEGAPFTISGITINKEKVYKDNVTLTFEITIDKDIKNEYGSLEKRLFIFYKALNKDGKDIPGVVSVATNFKKVKLSKDNSLNISGQLGPLGLLENFAKLKIISKNEYEQLK